MPLRRLINLFYALMVEGLDRAGKTRLDLALNAPLGIDAYSAGVFVSAQPTEEERLEQHRESVKVAQPGVQELMKLMKGQAARA